MPPLDGGGFIFGEDSDRVLVKDYFAIVVAELANSYQVVLEGGHDVGIVDQELVETDVCLG